MFCRTLVKLGALLIFVISQNVFAEINLSADSSQISTKARAIESEYSREMRKESFTSTLKMRETRKVGAGLSAGGSLGTMGFNVEFNFEDENGVLTGFGTGRGYSSFQLAWKHAFEGDYLAPYTTLGYSRWYNSHGSLEAGKSDILNRVLTAQEKREGRFGADFLNATLGIQYNQLSGELAGISVFGELTAMLEVKRSILMPNGAVGLLYYF